MNQRLLLKTIESFDSKKFFSTEELLSHVLNQIVANDRIEIKGGRVWKLDSAKYAYELISQAGAVEKIKPHFAIKIDDYRMFKQLTRHQTIVAKETNDYLKSKGIGKYSATGVGEIVNVRGTDLYSYILSFNTDLDHERVAPTLNIIGFAVTSMLKNRRMEKASTLLQKDLDRASEIQKSILPAHELQFHNYEVFGISLADRVVGGDFFDYIISDDKNRVGIVIGDAASKGISAAVQALYVSGALRMGATYQTQISSLIRNINALVHHAFTDDRFLTLFYAELINDKNGLCVYVNAGHSSPIVYRAATNTTELLDATGNIVGPFPSQTYRSEGIMLKKGDILLLYTDGVSEAMDVNSVQYSEQRLISKLVELKNEKAQNIARLIIGDVQAHSAKGKYTDDKTLVVVKRVK
ncbi:MAG: PP2C family protein-serine/threonine phosphatase [Bacteroidota bacterium]|jgi:sigma-B regulation protein RsbU (phosphoserine phosphatase)